MSRTPDFRPWAYEPLGAAVGGSTKHQARVLGVDTRQVYRWKAYGLTDAQADELAIGIRLHPWFVWPDWHDRCDEVLGGRMALSA